MRARKADNWVWGKMKSLMKRAQEEMVGFVLIIVLVAVIALVFLAISLRKPAAERGSEEITNFLHSSMLYTTGCQPRGGEVYNFKELITACLGNENCLNNESACDILNKTASELINLGFQAGEDAKYKGYVMKIYGENNQTLFYLAKGKTAGNKLADEVRVYGGAVETAVRLELYY